MCACSLSTPPPAPPALHLRLPLGRVALAPRPLRPCALLRAARGGLLHRGHLRLGRALFAAAILPAAVLHARGGGATGAALEAAATCTLGAHVWVGASAYAQVQMDGAPNGACARHERCTRAHQHWLCTAAPCRHARVSCQLSKYAHKRLCTQAAVHASAHTERAHQRGLDLHGHAVVPRGHVPDLPAARQRQSSAQGQAGPVSGSHCVQHVCRS